MLLRIFAILLTLVVAAPARTGTKSALRMVIRDHAVSAKLDGVPLPAVLARLSEATGAELAGETAQPRDVTLTLRRVPFEEALKRLLGTQSFTLTYQRSGGLKRITLGGMASGAFAPSKPGADGHSTTPATSGDEAKEAGQRLVRFLQANQPIRINGPVARFLGADAAPFGDVLQAALKNEDQRVRAQARRLMVEALAANPEVRSALATAIGALPDETLVAVLRNAAGVDAQELAEAFARYGRSRELTRSMQRALEEMRARPVGRPPGR